MKLKATPENIKEGQEIITNWIDSPIKELLSKYMQLVMSEESVSYISNCNDGWNHPEAPRFTDEEIEVLTEIEKKILKEFYE